MKVDLGARKIQTDQIATSDIGEYDRLISTLNLFHTQKPRLALNKQMMENQTAQLLIQEKQLALKQHFISLQAEEVKLLSGLIDDFSEAIVSKFQPSSESILPLSSQPKPHIGVSPVGSVLYDCRKVDFLQSIQVAAASLKPLNPNHKRKSSTFSFGVWDRIQKKFKNANENDENSDESRWA